MATGTELLKEVLVKTGANTETLPDNLATTLLTAIATNMNSGGAGATGGNIPTKNSQLENDSNYITKEVGNLDNYYTKDDVNNIVDSINGMKCEVVEELPTSDINESTIYLVLKEGNAGENVYNEFLYINGVWELIGTTEIDLTNYYTKDDVDSLVENVIDDAQTSDNKTWSSDKISQTLDGYLSKDGGTIKGAVVETAISFQSVDNGYCGITKHHDETTDNGMLLQDTSKDGKITAIKLNAVNGKATFHTSASNAEEILHTGNIESFVGVNVPRTEVALDSTNFSGGTVAYTIVNGICYVDISALSPIDLGGHKHVNLDALPTPATNIFTNGIYDIEVASSEPLNSFYMNGGYGVLICHVRHISATYCSFSYPIMTE